MAAMVPLGTMAALDMTALMRKMSADADWYKQHRGEGQQA
jgi:hypothetical protein